MLAVVPLENLTGHSENASLASGLTDELLTQLGAIDPGRLAVIGRTSVARYTASKSSLAEIRRDLGVDYIVEGSVRAEEATIRISLRLLKAAPQSQVWSQIWQVEPRAQIETEQDIAVTATLAIAARLVPPNQPPRARPHSPPPAAHDAWLNGRYLQRNRNREDNARAIAFFERAAALDPAWSAPWTSIGEARLGVALAGGPAADAFAAARTAAGRALKLDPNIAEAHNVLANVLFWNDWNGPEARAHFERAVALNPSLGRAHHDYAMLEIVTGRAEAGVTSLRRALALDPLSPQVNIDAGWLFLQAHHFEEALRYARRALELEPALEEAQRCVARALLYQGKADADTLTRLRRLAAESANPYNRALAAAATGQPEVALAGLEQALQQRSHLLVMISTEPAFLHLHAEPRYQRVAAKVGF
jgi:TolB-like protein/Tfp pilus assembly protein PilF